ncbi:hypothetical protein [Rhizobacter sp. LjRoot28]|uniref:hypothetical protein n=1 Tax=Rhizobacter sp. LjRoot28 TaxID=3342309 RepID=UPI003ECFC89B
MGALQHLLAVAFLIFYSLAIGGFLGSRARRTVVLAAMLSATAFIAAADNLVHGILLTALAVLAVGVYLAVAWALKCVCEAALAPARMSYDLASSEMISALEEVEPGVIPGATVTA